VDGLLKLKGNNRGEEIVEKVEEGRSFGKDKEIKLNNLEYQRSNEQKRDIYGQIYRQGTEVDIRPQ